MTDMVTLIARTAPLERELKTSSRTVTRDDIPRLGELYFTAYEPGGAGENQQSAMERLKEKFAGKSAAFLPEASHVALDENGTIVAAILVLDRDPEERGADAPFIFELFTDREFRRRGLAEDLVQATMDTLFNTGREEVAVRVQETNSAALALYLSLDFRRWHAEDDGE